MLKTIRDALMQPLPSMQRKGNGCRLLCLIYIYRVAYDLYDRFGSGMLPVDPFRKLDDENLVWIWRLDPL